MTLKTILGSGNDDMKQREIKTVIRTNAHTHVRKEILFLRL